MGVTIRDAFSGLDNALFRGLDQRGLLAGVCHADLPPSWRALMLAAAFRLPKRRWFFAWQQAMTKTPASFRRRSRVVAKQLRRSVDDYDVVLQLGGLFASFDHDFPRPLAVVCDYTTKLAEQNYPPWFGLKPRRARAWYELETNLYRRAARIFTASENTRRSLILHYGAPSDRVTVIGEGVSGTVEHPDKTYDEQTVLMVGIDFERKGGPTVLRAFRDVVRHLPHARLLVIGPNAGPVQARVEWLGHVSDRDQLSRLFAAATVLVLPSVCEPFGLALIEAMAHGLPVIGSKVDAMPEIVSDNEHGYLIAPGDATALAERLIALLSSPDLCARMGEAGRERVRRQFLWSQVVDRLVSGLSEIDLNDRGGRCASSLLRSDQGS